MHRLSAEARFSRTRRHGWVVSTLAGTHLVDGKVKVDRGHYPVSKFFVDDALQPLRERTESRASMSHYDRNSSHFTTGQIRRVYRPFIGNNSIARAHSHASRLRYYPPIHTSAYIAGIGIHPFFCIRLKWTRVASSLTIISITSKECVYLRPY